GRVPTVDDRDYVGLFGADHGQVGQIVQSQSRCRQVPNGDAADAVSMVTFFATPLSSAEQRRSIQVEAPLSVSAP
ncbi:MAG: hypothetical protein MK538_12150, partial [Planctomycetes bacterium]|nr:hypothetical protein [Planctomycetota bacterium]